MSTKDKPDFMADMPGWSKVLLQLGFAGVIALLFVIDSRDRSTQLRETQVETRQQARDDRALFRDEMKMQRDVLGNAVTEMKRAIDALTLQHNMLKRDVDDMKFPIPAPRMKQPDNPNP